MYERFTDRARKTMQLSNQAAQRWNHEYIGTEHILLGLIKEGSGIASTALKFMNVDVSAVQSYVEKLLQRGPDMVTMGKLPQTPRAKKVIEYAMEASRDLKHNHVGTEHLLIGLARDREGIASQALASVGATTETVTAAVVSLIESWKGDSYQDETEEPDSTSVVMAAFHTIVGFAPNRSESLEILSAAVLLIRKCGSPERAVAILTKFQEALSSPLPKAE